MKVLHVNRAENTGGAARAVNRLHNALIKEGVDSHMLVMEKSTDDPNVHSPFSKLGHEYNKLLPNISALPILRYNKTRERTIFSPQFLARDLSNIINQFKPDLVHLHWINAGFLNLGCLANIKAPIVWSFHDNWPLTGGCHVKGDCQRYQNECGKCPILGSKNTKDLSQRLFLKKKREISKRPDLNVIGLSNWLANLIKESPIYRNVGIHQIPNLIPTDLYKPRDRSYSRKLFNLPRDKKLILFGAYHSTSDKNKGYETLLSALELVKSKAVEFVVFGSKHIKEIKGIKTHAVGHLYDDISLSHLYSAADCSVIPSYQENLSNVIMESLSCGTPVACFDTGGNSDQVVHKINGYLAKKFSQGDLAHGIEYILSENQERMSKVAREKVLEEFSEKVVSEKYTSLYKELIDRSQH